MNSQNLPIGVFDSGSGGLSTLRALKEAFPNESFVYFGDFFYLPYGEKTQDFLKKRTKQIIHFLKDFPCKAIVIACNTASASIMEDKKFLESFPVPIFNVIDPVIEICRNQPDIKKISVLATNACIESGIYQKKLAALNKNVPIDGIKASPLVTLIEQDPFFDNLSNQDFLWKTYTGHVTDNPSHTLILGCTHFPFIQPVIQKQLPLINIVESGTAVISQLKILFEEQTILNLLKQNSITILATEKSSVFQKLLNNIFNREIHYKVIDFPYNG
jgi:glutamate racemase